MSFDVCFKDLGGSGPGVGRRSRSVALGWGTPVPSFPRGVPVERFSNADLRRLLRPDSLFGNSYGRGLPARVKYLCLQSPIFYVIGFLLLTETRVGPALFIGHPLPVNVYVMISWVLDAVLMAVSLVMWRIDK